MKNTKGYRKVSCKKQWGALRELVNLPDPPEAVEQFRRTEAVDKFKREHPGYAGKFSTRIAQMLLQQAWHGGKEADKAATKLLSGQWSLATMKDDIQKRITKGAEPPMIETDDAAFYQSPIRADWASGELVYKWPSPLEKDFYNLLKISDHALICKRYGHGCPAPYFVAKKTPRDYCGPKCSQEAQKKSKDKYEEKRQARKKKEAAVKRSKRQASRATRKQRAA